METDRCFIEMIRKGEIKAAKRWLPDYAKAVVAEMGGRNIATMLGTIDDANPRLVGASYGAYGQSSASGNISLSVQEAA
jgi:3,4-dihydroxyphenylacetate 2,3-dioxygenase